MDSVRTMVTQLIRHERIETTLAKAKEVKKFADRAVTLGKKNTKESKELASKLVKGDDELFKLFHEIAYRYQFRDGGYTRVIPSRVRKLDSAKLAYIEFVDRLGELRPARPPQGFFPKSAEMVIQTKEKEMSKLTEQTETSVVSGSIETTGTSIMPESIETTETTETPLESEKKPKRFFGLF